MKRALLGVLSVWLASSTSAPAQEPVGLPRHAIVFAHHADPGRKDYDIWRVAADGTLLASVVTLPGNQSQFGLSPDGESIVYVSSIEGRRQLFLRGFLGGEPESLSDGESNDWSPVWSPDGRRLALASDRDAEKPELYLLDLESRETTRLTENEWYDSDLTWTPDGRRILFTRFFPSSEQEKRSGHGAIFEFDLDTGAERQLTDLGGYCGGADVSPDGHRIAFHRVFEGTSELWMMGAHGQEPRAITATFLDEYSPAWSPEGDWLVCTVGVEHDGRGTFDLWLIRPDGSERRLVSDAPNTQMEPEWRRGAALVR